MNARSAFEYVAAHGGAMHAYRTYLEEHEVALPRASLAETVARETSMLAQLSPVERLHRVIEYLVASPTYFYHSEECERRNP